MKNLPIGIQTLPRMRETNSVYVDKTELVHKLVTKGAYYFLARPRRFGKSLLVSTLKELFEGNCEVFNGLWIQDNWDWDTAFPVLRLSFEFMDYAQSGLEQVLLNALGDYAAQFDVPLQGSSYKAQFGNLIRSLSEKYGPVVLLVDEYDKPIIDFLTPEGMATAKLNRDILREFYGVLKSSDPYLRLVFITGVSKFSKVSIFSHLNNLDDITLAKDYATLTGYTQEELEHYFDDYLERASIDLQLTKQQLLDAMREWYNGYSWDGLHKVYNPFGVLNFLSKRQFLNFWFATGNPRLLVEQMRSVGVYEVEGVTVNNVVFEKYDLDNLELLPLLFQTGYLTVTHVDAMHGDYTLTYPNREVRESMYQVLIDDLASNPRRPHTGLTVRDLKRAFDQADLAGVRQIIASLLADLPHEVFGKQGEGLYHGLIHLLFQYLGIYAHSEVHGAHGRADAVVQTDTDVYVFEFKFNKPAQEGMAQIRRAGYAENYRASGRSITGIAVSFDPATREIAEWLEEDL